MRLSVCTPYWNRQAALDGMFANYARVYAGAGLDIEFSVCDDGSPVPAVVPEGVILTRLPKKDHPLNPCVPINVAVRASTADVVVLTGPEVEHTEPTLLRMLELLEGPDDYVMASCYDPRGFWLAGTEVDYSTRGREPVPPGGHFHFCVMFHRALFERAGGFDEDYRHLHGADDNDWLFRLRRAGAVFKLCPSVVIHHREGFLKWGLPHGRKLFRQKWPNAYV